MMSAVESLICMIRYRLYLLVYRLILQTAEELILV